MSALHHLMKRAPKANKYDFGHVLVIGGTPGMVGAPLLVAEAALRTGTGLVTIASLPNVTDKLERRIKEIMTLRLPHNEEAAAKAIMSFIAKRHVSTVVLGPGLGPEQDGLVRALAQTVHLPMVIDAGALTAFAGHLPLLKDAGSQNPAVVLTPHAGEYERLAGHKLTANAADNTKLAIQFARQYHVSLVLKGHPTIVAHPDGKHYQSPTGNAGMATAGSGDVLSGVIAGILAQEQNTQAEDIEAGVYLHGLAGDLAANDKTQPGMIASDITEYLPVALQRSLR